MTRTVGLHFRGQKVKGQSHQATLLTAALTREAGAAVTVRTYWAWETTLRLLGGARGAGAPMGEERGGAYPVATRIACYNRTAEAGVERGFTTVQLVAAVRTVALSVAHSLQIRTRPVSYAREFAHFARCRNTQTTSHSALPQWRTYPSLQKKQRAEPTAALSWRYPTLNYL